MYVTTLSQIIIRFGHTIYRGCTSIHSEARSSRCHAGIPKWMMVPEESNTIYWLRASRDLHSFILAKSTEAEDRKETCYL